MATVEIQKLSKIYRSGKELVRALDNVSFTADDGRITALVGPSGCGKTTLLRVIAGLETPDDGEIRIDHAAVNHVQPRDRDVAMVFQNYALYPHMTVYDNMAFGLKVRRLEKKEIRRRIDETAAMLKIESLLTRKPRELSGGQRQRVAIGRALVRRPKVFLMDEPLSNLDAQLRNEMRIELYRLARDLRWTMIYVTHDQLEAMTLADAMVILKDGTIRQAGSPDALFHRPADTFVASFIGLPAMNLLRGKSDGTCWRSDDGLPFTPGNGVPPQTAVIGIRPDRLTIASTPDDHTIAVHLRWVEKTGSDELVHFQWGTQTLTVRRPASETPPPQAGFVRFASDHLHYFDAAGLRL